MLNPVLLDQATESGKKHLYNIEKWETGAILTLFCVVYAIFDAALFLPNPFSVPGMPEPGV
jgi:hypothetical protein